MANGEGLLGGFLPAQGSGFEGLLGSPAVNIGLGLMAAGGPSPQPVSLGQALGQGVQFAQNAQQQNLRNQLLRQGVQQRAQQQEARGRLAGLLEPGTVGVGTVDPQTGIATVGPEGGVQAPGAGLMRAGGIQSPEVMGLLAQAAPEQFTQGLLSRAFPEPQKPTSLQRNFEFLTSPAIGLSRDEALGALQSGTTVNVGGGKLAEPMKPNDLLKLRLPDGSTPPLGTTPNQALQSGAQLMSTEQQKALDAAQRVGPVLDRIEELGTGEGGIFTEVQPGLGNRIKSGFDMFISSLDRENPAVAEFDALVGGTMTLILRQMGEAGALSDSDIARAGQLLPQIRGEFLLPDTREDAINKLNNLREILEKGAQNLESSVSGGAPGSRRRGGQRLRFDERGNPVQ